MIPEDKLLVLSGMIKDRLEEVLSHLNVDYKSNYRRISCCCPVHDSDNPQAVSIYADTGVWCCRTRNCHLKYGKNLFGLIRGILSYNKGREINFRQTIRFCEQFLNTTIEKLEVDEEAIDKYRFIQQANIIKRQSDKVVGIPRHKVISELIIPCDYFVKRGFSREVLKKYDVGLCLKKGKAMFGRAVVPVYDDTGQYLIGCTGRATNHNPIKWLNSKGFRVEEHLYNYWYAKTAIKQSKKVAIVESPGNVWKLVENGISNVLGLFGSILNDPQQIILEKSSVNDVYLVLDNDEAGRNGTELIKKQLSRLFNVHVPKIDYEDKSDIAELSNQSLKPLCKMLG